MTSLIEHPSVSELLPAYSVSFNKTSACLKIPFHFKANVDTSPHCMTLSLPQQCATRQPLSPQQSLAIEQFKFSSLSNTPAPSFNDEYSDASPLPVEECRDKRRSAKTDTKRCRSTKSKLLR